MAFLALIVLCALALVFLLPRFGALPGKGKTREYPRQGLDRAFSSCRSVPLRRDGVSLVSMLARYFLVPKKDLRPAHPLPVVRPDFQALPGRDICIWLGHSSWYCRVGGHSLLVDPVFSSHASPFFLSTRAFAGTDVVTAADLPPVDWLLISHDHWDHLDYRTVSSLRPKVGMVGCGLGVGDHFRRWAYPEGQIREVDWEEEVTSGSLRLRFLPTRHYSGRRTMHRHRLWGAWMVESEDTRILYTGDSGYGEHFSAIGLRYGPFDLVLVENGQYDADWPHIHMTPEQAVQAAVDLSARSVIPVHSGRFAIAGHPWYEPFIRFQQTAQGKPFRLLFPKIGQTVDIHDPQIITEPWWNASDARDAPSCG